MKIVLASASPRRRELLTMLGVQDLKIIPPVGPEAVAAGAAPNEAVLSLSRDKALEVSKKCGSDEIIIAADTVVAIDDKILGKPRNVGEAAEMLQNLSGRMHTVYTGVSVIKGDKMISEFEQTRVFFRQMTRREIDVYVATGEPMDKAGAYGAQGIGALFVEKIEGDFFNVMGLPLCRLSKMLEKLDVTLL